MPPGCLPWRASVVRVRKPFLHLILVMKVWFKPLAEDRIMKNILSGRVIQNCQSHICNHRRLKDDTPVTFYGRNGGQRDPQNPFFAAGQWGQFYPSFTRNWGVTWSTDDDGLCHESSAEQLESKDLFFFFFLDSTSLSLTSPFISGQVNLNNL